MWVLSLTDSPLSPLLGSYTLSEERELSSWGTGFFLGQRQTNLSLPPVFLEKFNWGSGVGWYFVLRLSYQMISYQSHRLTLLKTERSP